LLSAETRWRACEEAFAAAAGPKRREALATGARHQKPDARFYTFLSYNTRPLPVLGDGLFFNKKAALLERNRVLMDLFFTFVSNCVTTEFNNS
jgi:hypothetical protein